jgi:hypothetical protein
MQVAAGAALLWMETLGKTSRNPYPTIADP